MKKFDVFEVAVYALKIIVLILSILFQITVLALAFIALKQTFRYFFWLEQLIVGLLMLKIIASNERTNFKISWLFLLAILPATGFFLYFTIGRKSFSESTRRRFFECEDKALSHLDINKDMINEIDDEDVRQQAQLIYNKSHFPLYKNTTCEYYELGDKFFVALKEDLKKAKKFIFMQYYILADGKMHREIMDILVERANAGVQVFYSFDSAGSIMTLPKNFKKECEENNIKYLAFNNKIRHLYRYISYRDHRKITVIDDKVGYVGGTNIADEYINEIVRFGHWKDMSVRLEGDAVRSFTTIFLKTWEYEKREFFNYDDFYTDSPVVDAKGYVSVFDDGPMTADDPAENNYVKMITSAKEYVYITTPYLIPTDLLMSALKLACDSGVDVRILTPHIPDKKIIFNLTRSYYPDLAEMGVKIYEYTEGFVHGKTLVSDDKVALVGTINFDYRSLAWNYECGAWVYEEEFAKKVRTDFLDTVERSEQCVNVKNLSQYRKIRNSFLRVLSPLL